MKKEMIVLGINGSPNKNGLCVNLLKQSLKEAKNHGAKIKIIHLIDVLKEPYHSNYNKKVENDFKELYKEILNADGFILATPVYWMNMSSLIKNFLEKLTIFELENFKLEGKVAGFIAVCEEDGGWKTVLDMAGPLSHMGVLFPPYSMVFYNKRFAKKSDNAWMTKDTKLMAKNLVELIKMTHSYKPNWDYKK